MERKVLVLTSWFFPYQILAWQDAVRLLYLDSATVVAEYDEELRSPSTTWKMPAVVRLRKNLELKRKVKYSRMNVFLRDRHTCQYCGKRKSDRELTQDHLIPRKNGGTTCFENIVTACKPCNSKKGCKTSDESGFFPFKIPVRPKSLPLAIPVKDLEHAPKEWYDYLSPYLPACS
jgi:5-methylcytosine-specific restriction endonuclease McrA